MKLARLKLAVDYKQKKVFISGCLMKIAMLLVLNASHGQLARNCRGETSTFPLILWWMWNEVHSVWWVAMHYCCDCFVVEWKLHSGTVIAVIWVWKRIPYELDCLIVQSINLQTNRNHAFSPVSFLSLSLSLSLSLFLFLSNDVTGFIHYRFQIHSLCSWLNTCTPQLE